jgi:hypothetical protein
MENQSWAEIGLCITMMLMALESVILIAAVLFKGVIKWLLSKIIFFK